MWWLDRTTDDRRQTTERSLPSVLCRLSSVLCLAALLAGCFQPLYGDSTVTGKPGVRDALSSINVKQIDAPNGTPEARIAVELRNQLLFGLTGGAGTNSPTHELTIGMVSNRTALIVDLESQRPTMDSFGLDITYTLKDLATGKNVLQSTTFARVSYDTPTTGEQRFARVRGLRDAENRAAKVVAEQIRNRLASYFVAGT